MKLFAYLLELYHQNSNAILQLYAPLLSVPLASFNRQVEVNLLPRRGEDMHVEIFGG